MKPVITMAFVTGSANGRAGLLSGGFAVTLGVVSTRPCGELAGFARGTVESVVACRMVLVIPTIKKFVSRSRL